MSGLSVIYQRDGAPAAPATLQQMADAIAQQPADATGQWFDGPIGLACRALHTTPEAQREQQPLYDGGAQLALVFDGRVDNRDELLDALAAPPAATDADLVLRAYERWGEDCPARILGDFAFALWDARRRQLFCARDYLGARPFYYYADAKLFLCGSELSQILAGAGRAWEINEGLVGECLAANVASREETLYRNVWRLTPGHWLRVGPERLEKRCYWDFSAIRRVRYRRDDDYAEHFAEIFQAAVRCRLRAVGPVGAHLSGGLDSSSVVSVAHALTQDAAQDLATFSMLFPARPETDESEYIEQTANRLRIKPHLLYPGVVSNDWYTSQAQLYLSLPGYPNGALGNTIRETARRQGIRVILTGNGGDEWFSGARLLWAELLQEGHLRELLDEVRGARLQSGLAATGNQLLRQGFWPLMPGFVHELKQRLTRRETTPPGLVPDFARRINLAERLRVPRARLRGLTVAQQAVYQQGVCGPLAHGYELEARFAAAYGLEERHPFLDRRVAEFALGLPEEQRRNSETYKRVLRHAMRGRLPEEVRQRRAKADFSHVFPETLRAVWPAGLPDQLEVCKAGWVDPAATRSAYRALQEGYQSGASGYTKNMWWLWMVYSVETWFKAALSAQTPPISLKNSALVTARVNF